MPDIQVCEICGLKLHSLNKYTIYIPSYNKSVLTTVCKYCYQDIKNSNVNSNSINLIDFNDYTKKAMRTSSYHNAMKNSNLKKEYRLLYRDRLSNCAFGLSGESGEIVDLIKKHLHQNKELNIEELKFEIGDLFWYIANLLDLLKLDLNEILNLNIEKLLERYPKKIK